MMDECRSIRPGPFNAANFASYILYIFIYKQSLLPYSTNYMLELYNVSVRSAYDHYTFRFRRYTNVMYSVYKLDL